MLIVKYYITPTHSNTVYAKRIKIEGAQLALLRVDDSLLEIDVLASQPISIKPMIRENPYERNRDRGPAGEWEDPLTDN
jgi:hypothetical protein